MFQLVNLIANTVYITIITMHRRLAHVCSVFKRAQSKPLMSLPDPSRLLV